MTGTSERGGDKGGAGATENVTSPKGSSKGDPAQGPPSGSFPTLQELGEGETSGSRSARALEKFELAVAFLRDLFSGCSEKCMSVDPCKGKPSDVGTTRKLLSSCRGGKREMTLESWKPCSLFIGFVDVSLLDRRLEFFESALVVKLMNDRH